MSEQIISEEEAYHLIGTGEYQVKYVNDYQPSSATLAIGDPIYSASTNKTDIQVGRAEIPTTTIAAALAVGGIILFAIFLWKG